MDEEVVSNKIEVNIKENNKMQENSKEEVGKSKKAGKIRNAILIILFNIIFPYLIFLISNINNEGFFLIREIRKKAIFMNFSYIYEIMIIYGFYFWFKAIFKKSLRANGAICILFNLISIISYYKIKIVLKPFLPEDLLMLGNATEIMQYANIKIEPIIIIQIFLSAVLLIIQYLITKYTQYEKAHNKIFRIIVILITSIIILVAFICNWSGMPLFNEDNIDLKADYYTYGGVINFFKKGYLVFQREKLDIYDENKLEEIKNEMNEMNNEVNTDEQPNIIVIMGEAFSDITEIKDLEFNENPLQNFKNLQNEYANGKTTVNVYGGETATSEFEFLTGSNMHFVTNKRYPYSQIINGNTISIVRTLKESGYETTAIHPNKASFYSRRSIYKYFGFDKTVFLENMEDIDEKYNNNVSDKDFIEEIIEQYESMETSKKFIFGISIESHLAYTDDKYENNEIEVSAKGLNQSQIKEIETYSQGLKHFDEAIKTLVDYLKEKDEKVMLVVFGDHLPALNTLYDKYYGDSLEKYQTPYLIWTNYEENIKVEKEISIPGLAMRTLENANVELPWYYKYIAEFYNEYPVFTKKFIKDKNGNSIDINLRNELIDNYSIIQYDILYRKSIPIE